MASAQYDSLPYRPDSQWLADALVEMPGFSWLDSARPLSARGELDILCGAPLEQHTYSINDYKTYSYETLLNYFGTIKETLQRYHCEQPFAGGAVGYCSYEMGLLLQGLPLNSVSDELPLAQWSIYSWLVLNDHRQQRCQLICHPLCPPAQRREVLQRLGDATRHPQQQATAPFQLHSAVTANMTAADYAQAFDQIKAYIAAGDCYQINLAQRYSAAYSGDPFGAYRQLRNLAAAPYSAWLSIADGAIMSLSPELFLSQHQGQVITAPIKGTAARFSDAKADQDAAQSLLASAKNRAENLMIVDLLRNDLGRCSRHSSIVVEQLFELQSFATVHHLVSTIRAQLADGVDAIDLLLHCFPGGSITGAPKRRAMQIISELEFDSRQVYCGSIGYLGFDGRLLSNIPIRTLLCRHGQLQCWAGGGIVADSDCAEEYRECEIKVEKLFAGLQRQ